MNKITVLGVSLVMFLTPITYGQNEATRATASVQLIHNAADDALEVIDIYVNDKLVADNLKFRTATRFLELPANVPVWIDVANASSTSASQRFYRLNTTFASTSAHAIVADGVESTIEYRPGYPFTLFTHSTRMASGIAGNTDVIIHRGYANSPTIDIIAPAVAGETVTRDSYYRANAAQYYEILAVDHTVKVHNNAGEYLGSYIAPIRTLGLQGHAIMILGSGFTQQLPDRRDPEYGVFIAVGDGGDLIPLPLMPGNVMNFSEANIVMHPNPAREFLRFEFPFAYNNISATIVDNSGTTIRVIEDFGNRIDVSDIEEGIYTINLRIDDRLFADKFVKGL